MTRFWLLVAAALAAAVVGDILLGVEPPGVVAVFAFVGATTLAIGAKTYGKRVVYRPLDHESVPDVLPEDRLSDA